MHRLHRFIEFFVFMKIELLGYREYHVKKMFLYKSNSWVSIVQSDISPDKAYHLVL